MYEHLPSFILGFHGCDASLAEKVFRGKSELRESHNHYDWLGHGIYFWENNPGRAMDYARFLRDHPRRGRGKIHYPATIGAVIDLGFCLNLLDSQAIKIVQAGHRELRQTIAAAGLPMPVNRPVPGSKDLLLRSLDCAVIEFVHETRQAQHEHQYDSVRGVFIEGKPLYSNAGFFAQSHIQICVRTPDCIKGYFRPRD